MKRTLFVISAGLLVWLSGCSSNPQAGLDQADQQVIAGDIEQDDRRLHLVPVPLYGLPELSLGALWQATEPLQLELCDSRQRPVDSAKPLVLYLDGELEYLEYQRSDANSGCLYYQVNEAQLQQISDCKQVMLRVFFQQEVVEQRVSGTVSDYFSRPKYYGPQARLKRFITAVQQQPFKNPLVGG